MRRISTRCTRAMTLRMGDSMTVACSAYRASVVKPFCPCDTDRPQDCQPEDWPGAHAEPPCQNCGRKSYAHAGR